MKAKLGQEFFEVILGDAKSKKDNPLRAFRCQGNLPDTKQCWVPVIPNRPFCIHYALKGSVQLPLGGGLEGAGIFCELYIDGGVTERAFLLLNDGIREWEMTGKYYRGEGDEPHKERPFRFALRDIDPDAPNMVGLGGTICVILYWAKPNPAIPNPHPIPSKALADTLSQHFSRPVTKAESGRHMCRVRLGQPVDTGVTENNMQVEAVDDRRYTFVFHYAHPEWLTKQRIKPLEKPLKEATRGEGNVTKEPDGDPQKC